VIRALRYSKAFLRSARKIAKKHPFAAEAIATALERLSADAFDPRLNTHKLRGDLREEWGCTAAYDLRIVFRFVGQPGSEAILLLSVGPHDDVY
jgi:addiction module RelE/StbE family toxin